MHGELMMSFFAEGMEEWAVNVRFRALESKKKKKQGLARTFVSGRCKEEAVIEAVESS